MGKKIVIVGGVAGGASAATRLRRLDENAEIILFEKGAYVSFANCGLPYHIGEVIKEREALLVTTKEALWNRFRLDVRPNSEVVGVDSEKKIVKVIAKDRGSYEESFDELVLSPGAIPFKPPIEGIQSDLVYSLKNIPDTDAIKAKVDDGAKSAIVIGGGFIGIETAENLVERGLKVTLMEAAPHILAPLDTEISMIAEKEMREHGVELILNDGVAKFEEMPKGLKVTTSAGVVREADFVVAAIGVKPDTDFLKESGIELGDGGHILVDEHMKTSVDHIWAAGDAVMTRDFRTKEPAAIALAGPANRQGRMIADNIYEANETYEGSQGTSILKVFDLTAASTGHNERQLQKEGIPYNAFYAHPSSHAGYYPGAVQMTLKILTDETGKLLGAQGVGYDGVDKFIDTVATAMYFGGSFKDLAKLDLAYAPPYLSAKSPANMIGFVAENHFKGLVEEVTFTDYEKDFNPQTDVLLDVRTQEEADNGILDGATVIPLDELRDRLGELDKNKNYWAYCQIGLRGYIASRILSQHGFKVKNISGGYRLKSLGSVGPVSGPNNGNGQKAEDGRSDHDGSEMGSTHEGEDKLLSNEQRLDDVQTVELDACGLSCPGPLMKVSKVMAELKAGDHLKVKASDPGFYEDIQAFARRTCNQIVDLKKENGIITALLKAGKAKEVAESETKEDMGSTEAQKKKRIN